MVGVSVFVSVVGSSYPLKMAICCILISQLLIKYCNWSYFESFKLVDFCFCSLGWCHKRVWPSLGDLWKWTNVSSCISWVFIGMPQSSKFFLKDGVDMGNELWYWLLDVHVHFNEAFLASIIFSRMKPVIVDDNVLNCGTPLTTCSFYNTWLSALCISGFNS